MLRQAPELHSSSFSLRTAGADVCSWLQEVPPAAGLRTSTTALQHEWPFARLLNPTSGTFYEHDDMMNVTGIKTNH
jgi:hypothetical protein